MEPHTSQAGHGYSSDRLFYCPDLPDGIPESDGTTVILPESEARHISRALRLRPGDGIRLFDGRGRLYSAKLSDVSKTSVSAAVEDLIHTERPAACPVILLIATPKGKKSELVIEKCVELGVEQVIFFEAERSVARKSEKAAKVLKRWESIVVSACKQCGRTRLMPIGLADSLGEAVDFLPPDSARIAFWEESSAEPGDKIEAETAASLAALVGPEGGLTANEIKIARDAAFRVCSLGPRILRAETAAIVAATLLLRESGEIGIFTQTDSEGKS